MYCVHENYEMWMIRIVDMIVRENAVWFCRRERGTRVNISGLRRRLKCWKHCSIQILCDSTTSSRSHCQKANVWLCLWLSWWRQAHLRRKLWLLCCDIDNKVFQARNFKYLDRNNVDLRLSCWSWHRCLLMASWSCICYWKYSKSFCCLFKSPWGA